MRLGEILWRYWYNKDPEPLPKDICTAAQHGVTRYVREYVLQHLGLKRTGTTIPKNAQGRFTIDGHTFVLLAHQPHPKGWKTAKHRMFWEAPDGSLIPTGRINQSRHCGYKGPRRQKRGPKGQFVRTR